MLIRFFSTVLTLILVLWIAGYIAFLTHAAALAPSQKPRTSDAVVVLTGGYNRIRTGLELYAEGVAPKLFITGVHKDVTRKELLAQWTGNAPLPPGGITLGRKAATTRENAEETREWVEKNGVHTLHLVTSSYHMSRALLEFHRAMPGMTIIPYPVTEGHYALSRAKYWILSFSEYNKVIFRRIANLVEKEK